MEGYLGEFPVEIAKSEFADYDEKAWAMRYIARYSQIDGDHHKLWLLDQIARILSGAPISVVEARWNNGESEFRTTVGSSPRYEEWVEEMLGDVDADGETEYGYDTGSPP